MEWIRNTYKVPAEYGREISFNGRKGFIVEDKGNYIGVTFHDEKPTLVHPLHPTYNVEYLGLGCPRKLTRSQLRYKEWANTDTSLSFSEWLGIS